MESSGKKEIVYIKIEKKRHVKTIALLVLGFVAGIFFDSTGINLAKMINPEKKYVHTESRTVDNWKGTKRFHTKKSAKSKTDKRGYRKILKKLIEEIEEELKEKLIEESIEYIDISFFGDNDVGDQFVSKNFRYNTKTGSLVAPGRGENIITATDPVSTSSDSMDTKTSYDEDQKTFSESNVGVVTEYKYKEVVSPYR